LNQGPLVLNTAQAAHLSLDPVNTVFLLFTVLMNLLNLQKYLSVKTHKEAKVTSTVFLVATKDCMLFMRCRLLIKWAPGTIFSGHALFALKGNVVILLLG